MYYPQTTMLRGQHPSSAARPATPVRPRGARTDIIRLAQADTIGAVLRERARRTPDSPAYTQFDEDTQRWNTLTWAQAEREAARWQSALVREGLQAGDRVALMLPNCREWVLFDLAAQGLGLVTVPIYTNDRPENSAFILTDSGARVLLLEDEAHWHRLAGAAGALTGLQRVLCLHPVAWSEPGHSRIARVADWLPGGAGAFQVATAYTESLATIVYTSGTTGKPKGVMLSHRNLLWNVQAGLGVIGEVYPRDRLLSFLPLSHALERTVGYYLPMVAGSSVAFARSIPQLAEDLARTAPTIMISVPRIFERLRAKLLEKLATEPPLARWLLERTVDLGWRRFQRRQGRAERWSPVLLFAPLLDKLVGARVRSKLGGRLRFAICGGAPLPPEVARLFIGLGVTLVQGYGLTEASPVVSVNPLGDNIPASVGQVLPGVEARIGANRELLTRSPSVMLGYWKDETATRQVIDSGGWLHTGDQARLEDHHLYLTGRLKDLIVLANGEKVSPSDLELAIGLDPLFEQVMVIGEDRPFLAALAVLEPGAYRKLATALRLDPEDPETLRTPDLLDDLIERIGRQLHAFPGYVQIFRVSASLEPWTPGNGLLTPTLKLRRAEILARFEREVADLYEGHR